MDGGGNVRAGSGGRTEKEVLYGKREEEERGREKKGKDGGGG
jgi:hypothetical protein